MLEEELFGTSMSLLSDRIDMDLLLFPGFENREQLIDELARSFWYFAPISNTTKSIYILYRGSDLTQEGLDAMASNFAPYLADHFDPVISLWAKDWQGKLKLVLDPDKKKEENWSEKTSGIMVWGAMTEETQNNLKEIGDRTGYLYTCGDIHGIINEGANRNLLTGKLKDSVQHTRVDTRSKAAIGRLCAEVGGMESYVYGSAPSVSQVVESGYEFGDVTHIVCNSLVKNTELMDILKPKVVVCADPVFHGGPSRYAAEFRKTLNEFMGKYGSYLFTTKDFAWNFECCLDTEFHDKIIGLIPTNQGNANLDFTSDLSVLASENILSFMMLPVAFTLSEKVSVLGCDGRSFVQDDYFWSHDKKSQFNDLMEQTKIVHPAFFNRDFNEYLVYHSMKLEKILQAGEAMGKSVRMITPSYLPPLAKRYQAVL